MDHLYEAITGTPITDTLSEDEYQAAAEQVSARKKQEAEDWAAFLKELDMTDEEYVAVNQEFYAQFGGEFAVEAEEEPETVPGGRKKTTFPNKEMLCQQYLMCRDLFFRTDRRDLPDKLKNMLDFYLYEHGASSYLRDDAYFYTYALLNKVIKQIQSLPEGEAPQ